jgi:hypothetical protein
MKNQKIVKIISSSLLLSLLIASPALSGHKEYADQQQIQSSGEYWSASVMSNPGQIFRPEIKGHLIGVDLELQKVFGVTSDNTPVQPGDLTVEIVTVFEGDWTNPNLEVLATATINQVDISEQSPGWYQVKFDNPPVLDTNREYAILLRVTGQVPDVVDGTAASYSWYLSSNDETDLYPSGVFFFTSGNSMLFRDWLSPIAPRYIDATFITYMARGFN